MKVLVSWTDCAKGGDSISLTV
uniref:Uncharacterized protein n=1 Tax=Rhizophora mucronata TaxID=61149 RepID=A0A2P2PCI0_RHIMU